MPHASDMAAAAATGIAQSAKAREFLEAKLRRTADIVRIVREASPVLPGRAASEICRRASLAALIGAQYATEADMAAATPGDWGIAAPLFDEAPI